MTKATWKGVVLAESDDVNVVEGHAYFPRDSVDLDLLRSGGGASLCFWKGIARYFDVVVGERTNRRAAWHYPHPSPFAARKVGDRIAFWNGVTIEP
jgi:uncharacterized protein (DUF427 family)